MPNGISDTCRRLLGLSIFQKTTDPLPMKLVWMLIFFTYAFSTSAEEFSHIKLSPVFEEYIGHPEMKSMGSMLKGKDSGDLAPFQNKIQKHLLGSKTNTSLLKSKGLTNPFPTDGEESPLLERIREELESSHQEIGNREIGQLEIFNRQFNMGIQNFSGFSWQKPFGVVHVWADRQVTPNLFGDNWLIQDTFTFDIEASSFLEQTNEAGITSMSSAEIGAFAGITFKRVYTYYHYANSYEEGLRADFSKLFLPFVRMNLRGIEKMSSEEIMKREDNWSVKVGGVVTSPAFYGFSASGGLLAEAAYQNMVSVQNSEVESERYRVSTKSKKTASAGVSVSLQLDFFKLLKLTILNYDLEYEYSSSKEFKVSFSPNQWQAVMSHDEEKKELNKILHGYGKIKLLEPYVSSLDEDEASSFAHRGSVLIFGKLSKQKTEQVRIIRDEQVRVFFKNYSQNIRVVQNILSRLFSAAIYKIFKIPVGTNNMAVFDRQVNLEYDATHPQAADVEVARVESAEKFSFTITQSYEAAKTHRWIDKKFKNDVIWFVDSFTTLPKDYKTIIRNEQLKGPLKVESTLRIEKEGFSYFLNHSENTVFGYIANVCDSKKKSDWINADKRRKLLSKAQAGRELCVKNSGKSYLSFRQDYMANHLQPSLAKFKKFLTGYYKKSESLHDLVSLFGEENTFIHGQLKAKTGSNNDFVTSFSSGQFRGLGVIDNYKREIGSRQPASILSE